VLGEAVGELGGRGACALEPQRERADPADGEIGLERARRGSGELTSFAQNPDAHRLLGAGQASRDPLLHFFENNAPPGNSSSGQRSCRCHCSVLFSSTR
jgi:hypothetical protein